MEETCRLCQSVSYEVQSIFNSHSGQKISEVVMEVCPIDIEPDDGLPSMICEECLEIAFSAKELQKKSVENDRFFREKKEKEEKTFSRTSRKETIKFEIEDELEEDDSDEDYEIVPPKTKLSPSSSKFFCDFCSFSWDKREVVNAHMAFSHNSRTSETISKPKSKEDDESSVKRRKCDKCKPSIVFATISLYNKHVYIVHEKVCRDLNPEEIVQEFNCCKCEISFSDEEELMSHAEVHRKDFEVFRCGYWRHKIQNFAMFLEHLKLEIEPKNSLCLICDKKFPYNTRFVDHCRAHVRTQNAFDCEICGTRFQLQSTYDQHVKIKHQNQTLFVCPHCGKSLGGSENLKNHIKNIHIAPEKTHECKMCHHKFRALRSLKIHEAIHGTERPHICEYCGAKFKTKRNLVSHMQRNENHGRIIKRHKCDQCELSFISNGRLRMHKLTHSGAKPYQCDHCDKAYTSKGDLTKHQRINHIGNKIYTCEKCQESFRYLVKLREHQIVHADEN